MSEYQWKWTSKWGERGRMEANDDGTVMRVEQCDEPQGWSWETILPADTVRSDPSLIRSGWAPTLENAQRMAEKFVPVTLTFSLSEDEDRDAITAALADPVGLGAAYEAAFAAAASRPFSPFVQPTASQLVGQQFIVAIDGLEWCDVHAAGLPVTWDEAVAFVERVRADGWRLPSVGKLFGLFDHDRNECRIKPRFRPYWARQEGFTGVAWCVDLALGSVNTRLKGELAGVMLVREAK